jgi:hypothetical protein
MRYEATHATWGPDETAQDIADDFVDAIADWDRPGMEQRGRRRRRRRRGKVGKATSMWGIPEQAPSLGPG